MVIWSLPTKCLFEGQLQLFSYALLFLPNFMKVIWEGWVYYTRKNIYVLFYLDMHSL